jgi:hypothetical protein
MGIDRGIDLLEVFLDTGSETARPPGWLSLGRVWGEVGGIQQAEGLLPCVLLAHDTRVM